jgi:hypothetical protein
LRQFDQNIQKIATCEASLSRHNLSEAQRQERIVKIEDLQQKYKIQVRLKPCAALRFLVDVVYVMVEIRFRKHTRTIHLIWNPLSRRLDP